MSNGIGRSLIYSGSLVDGVANLTTGKSYRSDYQGFIVNYRLYGVNGEVVTQGQNGIDRLTIKIKTVNGETNNVVILSSEVITPSVDKVVKVGTKSVTDKAAWTETVVIGQKCSSCGKRK